MDSGNTWKIKPMGLIYCWLLDVEGKEERESNMIPRFLAYISCWIPTLLTLYTLAKVRLGGMSVSAGRTSIFSPRELG